MDAGNLLEVACSPLMAVGSPCRVVAVCPVLHPVWLLLLIYNCFHGLATAVAVEAAVALLGCVELLDSVAPLGCAAGPLDSAFLNLEQKLDCSVPPEE